MPAYISSSATSNHFHSRRLLLQPTLHHPRAQANYDSVPVNDQEPSGKGNIDTNVVMILSVLLCALVCSLGINSIVKCVLRCSSLISSSSGHGVGSSSHFANTGVKKKALKTFPIMSYSVGLKTPSMDDDCAICLSEFTPGERVRVMPKCNHGFHVRCIDKWLNSHSSCPTCRHSLIDTCKKIDQHILAPITQSFSPIEERTERIAPLEPEGMVRNYRA
ncbi:RING-H2 finger protein ATL78-like [Impatiens glandulifera]|uniref:RING-H2 finger protein ATL78-like n=1 Tax=Impatiens glandulifera TaxID=253017 RepID=UPI001FB12215|nr:RING-H2 finger protein ATL78-like [Impatiens glandulifera]